MFVFNSDLISIDTVHEDSFLWWFPYCFLNQKSTAKSLTLLKYETIRQSRGFILIVLCLRYWRNYENNNWKVRAKDNLYRPTIWWTILTNLRINVHNYSCMSSSALLVLYMYVNSTFRSCSWLSTAFLAVQLQSKLWFFSSHYPKGW